MLTCTVIRHAEKQRGEFFNPHLRHQDEPLSLRGEQQALALCSSLEKKPITAIYVSEYVRTGQTARPLAERLGIEPAVDPRLNEIDNGCFERMSDEEIQAKYPDIWQAYCARDRDFRFPEGESGAEAQQRVMSFLADLRRAHPDGQVALVAHDGLIRILICTVLGLPVYRRWDLVLDFAGISEIVYTPEHGAWQLARFNQSCGV